MASVPLMMYADDDIESGNSKTGRSSLADDFAYNNNVAQANVYIRMGFLRKVYGLLTIQLLVTTLIAGTLLLTPVVQQYVRNSPWLVTLALILSLVLVVALHFKRKESPTNLILLALFTVVEAFTVGVIVSFYDQLVVLQAFILTLTVCASLTAFTFQTKRDFTSMGAGLFAAVWILLLASFMQLFLGSNTFEFVVGIGGALVFSLFIVYDTQMLMSKLSPEEYILATINLYLDIINLFLYILRILEAARRN